MAPQRRAAWTGTPLGQSSHDEIPGAAGKHVRTSLGTNELPFNLPVEIELIVEVVPN